MLNKEYFKIIWVAILLLTLAGASSAQDKVGTTSAPFLGISIAPRATAMGGAFTAVADDATALYYNPGAISQMSSSQALVSHTEWLVGSSLNWVGVVLNLDGANAIGVSFTNLDYGEEEVTTESQQEGTGEMWSASDISIGLSYSRSFTDRFSIGGSVKYIEQKIWHEKSTAFAADVGLIFITAFNDMKLGMSISNFGNEMRMEGEDLLRKIDIDDEIIGNNETIVGNLKTDKWPLPLFFRVGLSMYVLETTFSKMLVAIDAVRPTDNSEIINVGGEFSVYDILFLRAGYKSLFRDESEEGLTFGMGLNITQVGGIAWKFDYTYADFGILDYIQMYSLSVSF